MAKKNLKIDTAIAVNQFEYNGKKYSVSKGASVPGANGVVVMTAADICADIVAQKYLVENGCSCVSEVTE